MTKETQTIPSEMIIFLAQKPEALGEFLAATGLGPQDLKEALEKPETMAGIMDYFLQNNSLMQEFMQDSEFSAKDILRARISLPGANLADLVSN